MSLADRVRADFPILSRTVGGRRLVYLDSAATAQKPRAVLDAVRLFYERSNANVHRSIHTLGEEATELYEGARDRVRAFIGARHREEIVFTKGTTEAINLVVHTWARRALVEGDEILLSEMEHHSNLVPWILLARERKLRLRHVPVTDEGTLDLEALRPPAHPPDAARGARPRLERPRARSTPSPRSSSARRRRAPGSSWTAPRRRRTCRSTWRRSAWTSTRSRATRWAAPTGIGALYGRREVLEPLEPFYGGSEIIREVWLDRATWNDLPWRFEPGTPPIAHAVGLGAAIDYVEGLGREDDPPARRGARRRRRSPAWPRSRTSSSTARGIRRSGRASSPSTSRASTRTTCRRPSTPRAWRCGPGTTARSRSCGGSGWPGPPGRASSSTRASTTSLALVDALRRARELLGSGRLRPSTH